MSEITRKLLLLFLADAGRMSLNWVEVNMSSLLTEIAENIEGSGLGLSLAREIARAHGGDITLNAAILGQTGFTLSLPVGDRD